MAFVSVKIDGLGKFLEQLMLSTLRAFFFFLTFFFFLVKTPY
jgi:hypothetical protein